MSAVINRVDCNLRYDGLKKQFCANQNDAIKNFSVAMSAVINRVDCNLHYDGLRGDKFMATTRHNTSFSEDKRSSE